MLKGRVVFVVSLFLLGFLFTLQATSQEEIQVFKHTDGRSISHLKILTPTNIETLLLEIFDQEDEMTHSIQMDYPLLTRDTAGNTKKAFYVTRGIEELSKTHRFVLYANNSRQKELRLEDVEAISLEKDLINPLSTGSEAMSIKVMTYNIHHGRNLLGSYTLDQMAKIIEESGADIVGLQEVDQNFIRSKFENQVKRLAEALSMEYAFGENMNFLGGKYGNAILSKYPIETYKNYRLPSNRETRGLLMAQINVQGQRVDFLVTHLGLNQEERMNQVDAIEKQLDTLGENVILVGDFNAPFNSREIQRLSTPLVDVGYATQNNLEPTFEVPFFQRRIDYIFAAPHFELDSYEVIKERASDHYPVVAELRFRP